MSYAAKDPSSVVEDSDHAFDIRNARAKAIQLWYRSKQIDGRRHEPSLVEYFP